MTRRSQHGDRSQAGLFRSSRRPLPHPRWLAALLLLLLPACERSTRTAETPPPNPLARQLAGARFDAARIALEKNRRDEAAMLLVSSLKADPTFPDALRSLRLLLSETHWQYPASEIDFGQSIEHLAIHGDSLWTAVSGGEQGFSAVARFDLKSSEVAAVLFPRHGESTASLTFSPDHEKVIVQRGSAGGDLTSLLCDAMTLKPVTELTGVPAQPVIPFSADSLLFAHAAGPLWHIRDGATGEMIRLAEDKKPVSNATLERRSLTLHHPDGTVFSIPVSPVDNPSEAKEEKSPAAARSGFSISGDRLTFADPYRGPIRSAAPITAAACDDTRVLFGNGEGSVEIQRLLPCPKTTGRAAGSVTFHPTNLDTLGSLAEAVTGLRFDEETRAFLPLSPSERLRDLDHCEAARLIELLPGLDFSNVRQAILDVPFKPASPSAALLLRDRIARAASDRPLYLALTSESATETSPQEAIRQLFRNGDSETIIAAVRRLPEKSPALATALSLALDSTQPGWIAVCLENAKDTPPFLRQVALSRIALLEDRLPDALAFWQNGFPDLAKVHRTEDWDGWEATDFDSRATKLFTVLKADLDSFSVPEVASGGQLQELAKRLLDPATTRTIGRAHHATACLAAADALAAFPDLTDTVVELCVLAKALGAPPARCLRVEASALTKKGDFDKAREAWISLISDYPIDVQQSTDYAEAAYTAFENGDSEQAMSILGTGVTHFPHDADFAYRAGWISLLTARYREAYEFLLAGERMGFPDARHEKATALLAIAAQATGDQQDAEHFYQQLVSISAEWSTDDPPKTDGWPDELKSALRQIHEPPKALPVFDE